MYLNEQSLELSSFEDPKEYDEVVWSKVELLRQRRLITKGAISTNPTALVQHEYIVK